MVCSRYFRAASASLAVLALATAVQAAPQFTLSYKVTNVYSPGTTTNVTGINYTGNNPGATYDYKIEVDALVTGLPTGQSFGIDAFDVTMAGATVSRPTGTHYNWAANNPIWVDDASTSHLVFSTNQDAGGSNADLLSITQVIDNSPSSDFAFGQDPADPRLGVAVGTAYKLGSFEVQWTGTNLATIGFANIAFNPIDDSTTQYLSAIPSNEVAGGTIALGTSAVPEPASLAMMGLGVLGLMARKRRRA